MQAHGIQGMALAIIKVLLRKSFLKKFLYQHLKLLKIIYKADTIRIEIMKLHIQHFLKPPSSSSYLTTMMNRELSLHNRGATAIRTDYNPAGNSRPHDICRSPTYIYQPTLGSSKTRTGPRHPRIQYSTNPAHCHVGTRYSRHLSTPSARVAILVIE